MTRLSPVPEYQALNGPASMDRGALCVITRPSDSPFGVLGTWRLGRVLAVDDGTDSGPVITHVRDRLGAYAVTLWRGHLDPRGRYAMAIRRNDRPSLRARDLWRAHRATVWRTYQDAADTILGYCY